MKGLTRSCVITRQAYDAAKIRLQRKWAETVRIMDLPSVEVKTESYWDRWARERVEATKFVKTTNVVVARSLVNAQKAAEIAVAAMREAAKAEAEALYVKMRAEQEDITIDIDFEKLTGVTGETIMFDGAWFKAWAAEQAKAQKAAAAAIALKMKAEAELAKTVLETAEELKRTKFLKLQREANEMAMLSILKMKEDAAKKAKAEIAKFVEIANMQFELDAARRNIQASSTTKVRAEAAIYAAELEAKILKAKEDANKDKIRWTTTFAVPQDLNVTWAKTGDLDWGAKFSSSGVVTEWLPAWWTRMVLD